MSGPLPSRLVLLSDLPGLNPGEKVRFLGCVEEYIASSATLVLKHQYPSSAPPTIALANIDHVREVVKSTELDVGAWVNVIGYVTSEPVEAPRGALQPKRGLKRRPDVARQVQVQALVLWSAGPVKLDAYERALEQRKYTELQSG
ncbi:hypothetical protein AOQ84DRAFT_380362 [Glonium stellatum]|uniref:CST complex subunit Ten1 n=1 Tax=Glonium stellatum TaxID=574774 RepID=A0A8E2JPF8_9PEZI|nr:hypothetical protein AOQ84DRAFT_380362 [Glonium stellatum]